MEPFIILGTAYGVVLVFGTPAIYAAAKIDRRDELNKMLKKALEKNREWYNKDDKTIIYEVNPMFNKLCVKI